MAKGIKYWTVELSQRFAVNDGYYLDKAITLLEHFQSGSVYPAKKRIRVGDITGLTPAEITFVLQALYHIEDFPVVLQRIETYGTPYMDEAGVKKTGMDFVLESTEYLGSALAILQSIKSSRSKYLVLDGDKFIYNGAPLKLNAGTMPFEMLRQIYAYGNGHSVEIKYEELCKIFRKIDKLPSQQDELIKRELVKLITAPTSTLGKKIKVVEFNNKPLIETVRGYGIKFNNG